MKFLFDLFPVILFFIAFKIYGIFVATAVAIAGTFLQIGWVWFRHRKVDTMLWVSLVIVTFFGGATLLLGRDLHQVEADRPLLALRRHPRRRCAVHEEEPDEVAAVRADAVADVAWTRMNWSWVGFSPSWASRILPSPTAFNRCLGQFQAVRRHRAHARFRTRAGHAAVQIHRRGEEMMFYVIIGEDRAGTLDKRLAVRPTTLPACRPCRVKGAC